MLYEATHARRGTATRLAPRPLPRRATLRTEEAAPMERRVHAGAARCRRRVAREAPRGARPRQGTKRRASRGCAEAAARGDRRLRGTLGERAADEKLFDVSDSEDDADVDDLDESELGGGGQRRVQGGAALSRLEIDRDVARVSSLLRRLPGRARLASRSKTSQKLEKIVKIVIAGTVATMGETMRRRRSGSWSISA